MASSNQKIKKGPYLPNIEAILAMGINPKTGLPLKMGGATHHLKEQFRSWLRVKDEQQAVMRYTWHNLPNGLDSQEIERMLYYRGQICIWWDEKTNKFFATPFALEGPIDIYGRPTQIYPVPLVDGVTQDQKAQIKVLKDVYSKRKLTVLHEPILPEAIIADPTLPGRCAVILQDYTPQISQTILPRQSLNECIIDLESDMMPFMRTALLAGTGVRGIRVNNEDEAFQVFEASKSINDAALAGEMYVPAVADLEFQDFTESNVADSEQYLLAMQSLDNIRLSSYGLDNNGIFQKKERELVAEANMASGNIDLVMNDGLVQRQKKADIMRSIWGQMISVETSEAASGMDKDMDGEIAQETDDQNVMEGNYNV